MNAASGSRSFSWLPTHASFPNGQLCSELSLTAGTNKRKNKFSTLLPIGPNFHPADLLAPNCLLSLTLISTFTDAHIMRISFHMSRTFLKFSQNFFKVFSVPATTIPPPAPLLTTTIPRVLPPIPRPALCPSIILLDM